MPFKCVVGVVIIRNGYVRLSNSTASTIKSNESQTDMKFEKSKEQEQKGQRI